MKIFSAVLVLFAAAAVAGVAQPKFAQSASPVQGKTITVTGSGSVETVPDRATFSFTVTSLADTAKAALAKNADAADAVVAALKGAKVQTSGLGVDPRLDDEGTRIVGYTASTTVSADAPLAQIGGLIDAAVAAGADGVSGPSFSASDQEALYKQALQDAVADARAKALALAGAAGVTLGDVQTIAEGSAQPVPMPFNAAADAGATKIEPGTQTVSALVTVTYAAG
jgi:uncharacterized protein YggE